MTIDEIQKGYRDKRFSVREIVTEYLERIRKLDGTIGAFLTCLIGVPTSSVQKPSH